MPKPTVSPVVRSAQHQALIDRERVVAEARAAAGIDAQLEAITADRAARWKALLAGREETAEIRQWAADMAVVHGVGTIPSALVQIWRNRVPWLTALYIARYGEAEDFWPPHLTTGDLLRARSWLRGDHPEGVGTSPAGRPKPCQR